LDRITNTQTLTLSDRPELRIDPTNLISTGAIANTRNAQVYNVEAAGNVGPVFFQGEYFWFNVERLETTRLPSNHFEGGYAQASWVITGETRAYNVANAAYFAIVPTNPWSSSKGGWGAWEIAARYSYMNLNDNLGTSIANGGIYGGKQQIVTVGLNWYVNRNMRFMLDYYHGKIDKVATFSDTVVNPTTDVGAKFDAVALRSQVAF
jgi:phosphate-selective porin OprO/OprP